MFQTGILVRIVVLLSLYMLPVGACLAQETSEFAITVSSVKTTGNSEATKFVIDVSEPVAFSVFALSDPYRLVVDLPSMAFKVDQSLGQIERAMIENFRFGSFGGNRSRIVLDLSGPAKVNRAYSLPAVDDSPARVVIEMEAINGDEFDQQALKDVIRVKIDGKRAEQRVAVAAQIGAENQKDVIPRPLVVLDPGHGGIDTGAVSRNGVMESKIVLEFAKALKKALESDGLVRVVMTREKDEFISLSNRVTFAREREADLFISLHADIAPQSYVRGATVYTLSDKASDAIAQQMAHRENRSDILAGLEIEEKDDLVADILIDLTRRETSNHSALYSRTLVGALKSSIRLASRPRRSAGFKVLKAPEIPSVLLELGYLSNKADTEELMKQSWRQKAIRSIVNSVRTFFARRSLKSSGLVLPNSG